MSIISTTPPSWMISTPKPTLEKQRFHKLDIEVWSGSVRLDKIQGWLGNPRTEMQADDFEAQNGRPPTNEEMYQIVLADNDGKEGLKIRELAGSIYQNGVRVPLVLSYEGKLLDGNRRYYASMFLATEKAPAYERGRFKTLPVVVLPEGTGQDTENAIITEYNFADDFRNKWPYYVRATKVYDDEMDGLSKDDLAEKYSQTKSTIQTWLHAAQLCQRFLDYHENSFLSKRFAYNNFIFFDEMARNYRKKLDDANFREGVFAILLADYVDGNHRITQSNDAVRLDEMWENKDAWNALVSKKGRQAVKDAETILNVARMDGNNVDPNPALKRVTNALEKLVSAGSLGSADDELLSKFHRYAEQMPGIPTDPGSQVKKMIENLDAMTSRQIASLSENTVENLHKALERVSAMAESVSKLRTKT